MGALTDWTGVEPLPLGATILLEASAGTGKTWQIEGLVVRMVAEHEVPIDRVLVITFTNAATAELRDRIRRRLVKARDALASNLEPEDDAIEKMIWADADEREARRTLLATAVSSFDLASISTIHGFSQRILDQLAFESGQEPGLELLLDPRPIVQQLGDDELARVYAEASEQELRVLSDMGWSREPLGELARAMTKAVAPVLEPALAGVEDEAPLDAVRAWFRAKVALRRWLASDEAHECVRALRNELTKKRGRRLHNMRRAVAGDYIDRLKAWLDGPALRSTRLAGRVATAVDNLAVSGLEKYWTDGAATMPSFGAYPLFARVSALLAEQDRLWPRALLGFASRARRYVEAELVRAGQLTYATMLSRLAERIAEQADHDDGGALAQAIRARYDVALVDEFQDTDGAQWPVMRAVFAHPTRRLLIIGDPKQAIYAFRGADVHVYLDAARVADERATMRTNWRSDAPYVQAMNHVWAEGSGPFELTDIDYVQVGAAPGHRSSRIRGLPLQGDRDRRVFELRWVDGESLGAETRLISSKAVGQDTTAQLAAYDAARLLAGGTEIHIARDGELEAGWSPLRPGDIAVLVRTNSQAERVRRHLERLGVPSISAGRGSVVASPVLGWLSSWLDAVADPGRDRAARALATTPLFGWTAQDLATAVAATEAPSDATLEPEQLEAARRWDSWLRSIQFWAGVWPTRGFVRVLETALDDFDVLRRLLGARQGERYATDLRHLVELCHAEERRTRMGPSGLASWLRAARDSSADGGDDAEALRLESDAHAVQLVTIHKSKGLEYPVVLLPFAWADYQPNDRGGPLEWHAQLDEGTELRLNLEPGGPGRDRAAERSALEVRQEQLRLLYVALTRARHHAVAWLGPMGQAAADTGAHALGRLTLRARDDDGRPTEGPSPTFPKATGSKAGNSSHFVSPEERASQTQATWDAVRTRFERLADTSAGTVGWSVEGALEPRERLSLELASPGALAARPWPSGRSLVTPWQVSSYSAMVAGRTFDAGEPQRRGEVGATSAESARPEGVGPERGAPGGAQVELGEPRTDPLGLDAPIATRELHGGTEVGTWAHSVFENLDFQRCVGRDGRDLETLVSELGVRHGVRSTRQHELLVGALPAMLDTPLGGGDAALPAAFSLRALPPEDRLDELGFDFRLGAGNRWRDLPGVRDGRLNQQGARVALESRLGALDWGGDAWLRAVLDRAPAPGDPGDGGGVLPSIAGILTGFIDLTFRVPVPGDGAQHRYFVADYKTNRIAAPDQRRDSRRLHYTRPWMAWEMAHHGYHLQALLYTVALHRMLRQRVPDYRYDTHIGGHLYLFLRGMTGPETPRDGDQALGVFFDRWPASVVLGLDAALDGASTSAVRAIVDGATDRGRR